MSEQNKQMKAASAAGSMLAARPKIPTTVRLTAEAVEFLNALCVFCNTTQADVLEMCLFAHGPKLREQAMERFKLAQEYATLAAALEGNAPKPKAGGKRGKSARKP